MEDKKTTKKSTEEEEDRLDAELRKQRADDALREQMISSSININFKR